MKHKLVHAAVVLAAMSACSVFAQQRVGDDGRALDASNRIGSGGLNQGADVPRLGATGNQIVTGNVVGNRQFRGNIGYGDPNEFRGRLSTDTSDRFLRQSSGGDYTQRMTGQAPGVFYGNRTVSPPPADVVQQQGSGIYMPAPSGIRTGADMRLGTPIGGQSVALPRPGELIMAGQVDPSSSQNMLLTASPLYGIRQWNASDANDIETLNRSVLNPSSLSTNKARLSDLQVEAARKELNETMLPQDNSKKDGESKDTSPDMIQNLPLKTQSMDKGAQLGSEITSAQVGQPTGRDLGVRQSFAVPPEKQSAQIAELKKRMTTLLAEGKLTNAESARLYSAELREREKIDKQQKEEQAKKQAAMAANEPAKSTETPAPPVVDPGMAKTEPKVETPVEQKETPKVPTRIERMKVASLADGIPGKALHDKMAEAEARVKEGKFSAALDAYDAAEQIAPNNPLIALGRAHAELGASYYGRAENDLRAAVQAEPALLLAQYDLKTVIGEERIQFLMRDLREIAQNEQKQVRPVLLLAYLNYNIGNDQRAEIYLEQAAQRAGGNDQLIAKMKESWEFKK